MPHWLRLIVSFLRRLFGMPRASVAGGHGPSDKTAQPERLPAAEEHPHPVESPIVPSTDLPPPLVPAAEEPDVLSQKEEPRSETQSAAALTSGSTRSVEAAPSPATTEAIPPVSSRDMLSAVSGDEIPQDVVPGLTPTPAPAEQAEASVASLQTASQKPERYPAEIQPSAGDVPDRGRAAGSERTCTPSTAQLPSEVPEAIHGSFPPAPAAKPAPREKPKIDRGARRRPRPSTPPTYTPPVPPRPGRPQEAGVPTRPRVAGAAVDATLDIKVHLIFDRRSGARITLLPARRDGMPGEMSVGGDNQGQMTFVQLRDDCYEDVVLPDIGAALRDGVTWEGDPGGHGDQRWVLGGREVFVFAPATDCGMSGFISVPRLLLGEVQHVLTRSTRRAEACAALLQAGCMEPQVLEGNGIPDGWLMFRNVAPSRAVPASNERSIMNVLCPLADVEPHFLDGIRLEGRTWLLGHPPRIHFTGELHGQDVWIDGQRAEHSEDCGWTAPGWDSAGVHELYFAQQRLTYELRACDEAWTEWDAHSFRKGQAVCGACVLAPESRNGLRVRVPSRNPVLVGALPGQVYRCTQRAELRAESIPATVPFLPVWALPTDAARADQVNTRVVLLQRATPAALSALPKRGSVENCLVTDWHRAIRSASAKRLKTSPDDPETQALWRRFRDEAKHLRRALR